MHVYHSKAYLRTGASHARHVTACAAASSAMKCTVTRQAAPAQGCTAVTDLPCLEDALPARLHGLSEGLHIAKTSIERCQGYVVTRTRPCSRTAVAAASQQLQHILHTACLGLALLDVAQPASDACTGTNINKHASPSFQRESKRPSTMLL